MKKKQSKPAGFDYFDKLMRDLVKLSPKAGKPKPKPRPRKKK